MRAGNGSRSAGLRLRRAVLPPLLLLLLLLLAELLHALLVPLPHLLVLLRLRALLRRVRGIARDRGACGRARRRRRPLAAQLLHASAGRRCTLRCLRGRCLRANADAGRSAVP